MSASSRVSEAHAPLAVDSDRVVYNVFGLVVVLLVWPKGEPASGRKFWSWMVWDPNGLFLVLLGFARAVYKTLWYCVYW